MGLDGRIALVSGAARGIGRAIALALASDGADVGRSDIDAGAEETAAAVRGLHRRSCVVRADVSSAEEIAAGVATIVAELGSVDLLVNNAGIVNNIAPFAKMKQAAWEREIGVNLTGAFNLARAVIGPMAERGFGRIVNISSVAARGGLFNQAGYSATKAGLLGLTHTIALEYARFGVTCNAVLPGLIGTENVLGMPAEIREQAVAQTPARRLGRPEEMGRLVAFLCGEDAGFINGAEIDISGGGHLNTMVLGSRKELSGGPPKA
jgi:NAD(P)-dependent dehydrogenase (short-subunit alcohol dehydrogenase family)